MKERYNPPHRNRRHDDAPLSWSQQFYDGRKKREPRAACGFQVPEEDDR